MIRLSLYSFMFINGSVCNPLNDGKLANNGPWRWIIAARSHSIYTHIHTFTHTLTLTHLIQCQLFGLPYVSSSTPLYSFTRSPHCTSHGAIHTVAMRFSIQIHICCCMWAEPFIIFDWVRRLTAKTILHEIFFLFFFYSPLDWRLNGFVISRLPSIKINGNWKSQSIGHKIIITSSSICTSFTISFIDDGSTNFVSSTTIIAHFDRRRLIAASKCRESTECRIVFAFA